MSEKYVLKVELIQQYNFNEKEFVEERNIKLNMKAIQSGLIKQLGATELAVLIAIASYCDGEGEAFPSQRLLAEITGFSKTTVNKAIKKLIETEVNGSKILSRELTCLGNRKQFSIYSLMQEEKEAEKPKKKTARDYVHKFKALFEEEYDFPYVINYARDTSLIKKKLMADFTEEEVDLIIDRTIKTYTQKWATEKFPYPTISMMCSWIASAVIKELIQERKKQEENKKLILESQKAEDVSASRMNSLLDL